MSAEWDIDKYPIRYDLAAVPQPKHIVTYIGKKDVKHIVTHIVTHIDGVPGFKFANWPKSAGMGPRVYKTQSIHTKNKLRYCTGTI